MREDAKFCTRCGSPVRRATGSTGPPQDSDVYPSVYRGLKPTDLVEGSGATGQAPPPGFAPPAMSGFRVPDGSSPALGTERSVPLWVILSFLTCGIGLLVWIYRVSRELRDYSGGDDPNPGMDVLLTILTCGLWDMYLSYKYTRILNQFRKSQKLPEAQILPIVLVFSIVRLFIVSIAILQNELNELWRYLRAHPASS